LSFRAHPLNLPIFGKVAHEEVGLARARVEGLGGVLSDSGVGRLLAIRQRRGITPPIIGAATDEWGDREENRDQLHSFLHLTPPLSCVF